MSNRKLKKVLNQILLSANFKLNKDYVFLLSTNNTTNIKSYKGFEVHKFNIVKNDCIYLTQFKTVDLILNKSNN